MAIRPVESKLFQKTASKYLKSPNSAITKNFIKFLQLKMKSPNEPFGSSDKSSPGNSMFAQAVPKIRHAHLNRDISIWYQLEGDALNLYGVFSHADTGTGQPANIKKQKQLSVKFKNQSI